MPLYKYKALLPDGTIVKSEGMYESPEELFEELRLEGVLLLEYTKKREIFLPFFFKKIKRKELADFLHQLSVYLNSGISIISALEDIELETKNKAFKKIIQTIRSSLSKGVSVREAFERARVFNATVLSLIQIGEETGRLDKAFEEAAQHLYRIEEIISQSKRALIYPAFVFLAMTGALIFWIIYVLPKMLKMFSKMNIQLPTPTIILMHIVNFILKSKLYVLFLLISLVILFIFLNRFSKTQALVEKILLRVPIIGQVKRTTFLAFFFEYFALLFSAGFDMYQIFQLLKESFTHRYYLNVITQMEEDIIAGETIADVLKKHSIFRSFDVKMVSVGEKSGKLDSQMQRLSSIYYNEVKNMMDQLTKMIEPITLVVVGIIFLIIIVALLGPVYELVSRLSELV
ncbi:MAG: type II secretion system F family protein [Caldimicrobium sp.]|nr:type II secretion system F family protein [Caldimicrobium sp.]